MSVEQKCSRRLAVTNGNICLWALFEQQEYHQKASQLTRMDTTCLPEDFKAYLAQQELRENSKNTPTMGIITIDPFGDQEKYATCGCPAVDITALELRWYR